MAAKPDHGWMPGSAALKAGEPEALTQFAAQPRSGFVPTRGRCGRVAGAGKTKAAIIAKVQKLIALQWTHKPRPAAGCGWPMVETACPTGLDGEKGSAALAVAGRGRGAGWGRSDAFVRARRW